MLCAVNGEAEGPIISATALEATGVTKAAALILLDWLALVRFALTCRMKHPGS